MKVIKVTVLESQRSLLCGIKKIFSIRVILGNISKEIVMHNLLPFLDTPRLTQKT